MLLHGDSLILHIYRMERILPACLGDSKEKTSVLGLALNQCTGTGPTSELALGSHSRLGGFPFCGWRRQIQGHNACSHCTCRTQ